MNRAALLLFAVPLLQACCSPGKCPQARSGSRALDPAIARIEDFKARNGRYPVVLDDLEKGYADQVRRELLAGCPVCLNLRYQTDAFGYAMEYDYRSGGLNTCRYDSEGNLWKCRGEY
jgi:hypothetical protein